MTTTGHSPPHRHEQLTRRQAGLQVMPEQPEETDEICQSSPWLKAAGISVSPQRAGAELPDPGGAQAQELAELVEQRLQGVALSDRAGRQGFTDLLFLTPPGAMIARRETGILGKTGLDLIDRFSRRPTE